MTLEEIRKIAEDEEFFLPVTPAFILALLNRLKIAEEALTKITRWETCRTESTSWVLQTAREALSEIQKDLK